MRSNSIYVEKAFKSVLCGEILQHKDAHGNDRFFADRLVDGQHFDFYARSAAEYWLKLGGALHG